MFRTQNLPSGQFDNLGIQLPSTAALEKIYEAEFRPLADFINSLPPPKGGSKLVVHAGVVGPPKGAYGLDDLMHYQASSGIFSVYYTTEEKNPVTRLQKAFGKDNGTETKTHSVGMAFFFAGDTRDFAAERQKILEQVEKLFPGMAQNFTQPVPQPAPKSRQAGFKL